MSGLKPSVCVDAVFENQPILDAIATVKRSGINAFEFWGWWDKELDDLVEARDAHGMQISACCTRFISLVDPALREDYLAGLSETIAATKKLGTKTIISQVGDFRQGIDRSQQHASLVDGLKAAAPVDSPNVKVVFDIYHQQISEGQLIANITNNIDKIGHFHAAGNPGRNELDRGEIHYPQVFEAIQETTFDGYVGLEYWPVKDTETGLVTVANWF